MLFVIVVVVDGVESAMTLSNCSAYHMRRQYCSLLAQLLKLLSAKSPSSNPSPNSKPNCPNWLRDDPDRNCMMEGFEIIGEQSMVWFSMHWSANLSFDDLMRMHFFITEKNDSYDFSRIKTRVHVWFASSILQRKWCSLETMTSANWRIKSTKWVGRYFFRLD